MYLLKIQLIHAKNLFLQDYILQDLRTKTPVDWKGLLYANYRVAEVRIQSCGSGSRVAEVRIQSSGSGSRVVGPDPE